MSAKRPTITYDPQSRILSLRFVGGKSVDADVHGNVVMDYDADGRLVRLDIMECSLDEFRRAAPIRAMVRPRAQMSQRRRDVRRGHPHAHAGV